MQLIPASLQTTYANLLQAHLNQAEFDFDGAPFTMERRGKLYWYVNQRGVGASAPRQRYLGPDTEEMRARIETMRSQKSDREAVREACSRMVAQLRAGGIPGIDRQTGTAIRALMRSGVFRLGGTLVGTQAFRHYDLELGVVLSGQDAADKSLRETQDLDIAAFERLTNTIEDEADPDLAQSLIDLGYKPVTRLDRKKASSWRHTNSTYDIDFLTPSFDDDQRLTHLGSLNVWAQGLHYLDFLIKDPMPAVSIYMEGLLVQVPRPERYAVHKLIVSQKRKAGSGAKARKDVQQARAIIWAMAEDRPFEIHNAIAEADAMGEKWRKALDQALDVQFSARSARYNYEDDSVELEGRALGAARTFAVSGPAVSFFMEVESTPEVRLAAVNENRSKLEAAIKRQFRRTPSNKLPIGVTDLHPDDWR